MAELRIDSIGMSRLFDSLDSDLLVDLIAEEIADAATDFQEHTRPKTPYLTGRLLLSGNVIPDRNSVEFLNDAAEEGRESYASFVHGIGRPTKYSTMIEESFTRFFGSEFADALERLTAERLS